MKLLIPLALLLIIIVVFWIVKMKKRQKDENFQAVKKKRDDSLKQALSNPVEAEKAGLDEPYRPYKIEYSTGEGEDIHENLPMLQLTEKSRQSKKKYIFSYKDVIILGILFENATLLTHSENGQACGQIYFDRGIYNVRSLGICKIQIKRNRRMAIVDSYGIQLRSGDTIQIGQTEFRVNYINL